MKNKLRNGFVCAVVLASFVLAAPADSPKGDISGKVLRKADKKPLYDATVKVKGTDKATHTDKNGDYSFKSLDADKDYTLLISKEPLYDDGQTTINVKAKKTSQASDVELARNQANAMKMGELISLLDSEEFGKFERAISSLSEQCQGIKNDDCESIEQIQKEYKRGNMKTVRSKIDKFGNPSFKPLK